MKLTSRVIGRRMLVLGSIAIGITIGVASQAQAQVNILVSPMLALMPGATRDVHL